MGCLGLFAHARPLACDEALQSDGRQLGISEGDAAALLRPEQALPVYNTDCVELADREIFAPGNYGADFF